MSCDLCQINGGKYDFNKPCCRLRYLKTCRTADERRHWLRDWQTRYGDQSELKERFLEWWNGRQDNESVSVAAKDTRP